MKSLTCFSTFVPLLFAIYLTSRIFEVPPFQVENISKAIKDGSSKELAPHLDAAVEIKLGDIRGDYSKSQAELVMRDFFKKYPALDFIILQRGESSEHIHYIIGTYRSASDSFKVLVKTRAKADNLLKIYALEFTKEK